MLRIAEIDSTLVLSYPLWAAAVFFVYAVIALAFGRMRPRIVARLTVCSVLAALFVWLGIYFMTFQMTFDGQSARVYRLSDQGRSLPWQRVRSITVATRCGLIGYGRCIVITDSVGAELDMRINELSSDERHRVASFIVARVPAATLLPDRERWIAEVIDAPRR